MPFWARSTAAACAVPSPGTWLRRARPGPGGVAASVFVVIGGPRVVSSGGQTKTLAFRRGSLRVRWSGRSLAPVPPCPSVLPPGAGNKPKKAIKPQKRAKQRDEGYVG